jgi:hypothetical protein
MSHHATYTAGCDEVTQTPSLSDANGKRLLDKDMFACLTGRRDDLAVQAWWDGNDDCLDSLIGKQVTIIGVVRASVRFCEFPPFVSIPAAKGDKFGLWDVLNDVPGVAVAVFACADEANPQCSHGKGR